MKRSTLLAVLAAAVVAMPAAAQREGGGPGGRPMFNRNPITVLVDSAQSLGLSAEVTAQLRTMAGELDAQNKTPLDSLQAYRPQGGGGMGGGMEMTPEMRERMEHARPFMQQVRDNNRQAMEKAMALLTPEQQERAQAMMPRRGGGRGGPGGPGGPPQP